MIVPLLLLAVLVVIAVVAFLVLTRRRHLEPEPVVETPAQPDMQAEREQAQIVGTELLSRRVALDARRGALQGDTGLDEEFDRLLARYRAGEITEDQFEAEKIRLLGG